MKATRSIVPVLVVLTVLVAAALAIGMMGRGGQGQQKAALLDNGPNAGLSNEELVSRAISNTMGASSYHVDFEAEARVVYLGLQERLTLSGDLGPRPEQARLTVAYQREGPPDIRGTFLSYGMMMTATTDVVSTGEAWYESYDGGKTWSRPADFTPAFISTVFLCPVGGSMWLMCMAPGETFLGVLLEGKTVQDGSPRVEEVDGVTVRHVVADVEGAFEGRPSSSGPFVWAGGVKTLDLWVSTDVTPTIRQLKIGGVARVESGQAGSPASPAPRAVPSEPTKSQGNDYTLTWKLSRFNEQFEDVKAPQVEATPTPVPVKEYHMESYDSAIKVNRDGSLDIVETLSFVFTSGTFRRGLRTWDLDNIGSITIKGVSENRNSRVTSYREGNFDPDDSTTGVAGTYGIERSASEVRLRWIFDPTSNDMRTFQIAYHVDGAVRSNADRTWLDWYAVPPRWSSAINRSRVNVTFPEGLDTSKWDVRSIPAEAEVSKAGNTITWSADKNLDTGFEIGVDIPEGFLNAPGAPGMPRTGARETGGLVAPELVLVGAFGLMLVGWLLRRVGGTAEGSGKGVLR